MTTHKQVWQLSAVNAVMLVVVIVALVVANYELAFISSLILIASLVPHYLKASHDVHIPSTYVYIFSLFVFSSLFLGQYQKLYEVWHWYDAFIHFISAIGIGLIGFVVLYVYYVNNKLKIHKGVLVFYSFFFCLGVAALWEMWEFMIDRTTGSNMQVNLEDTMVDLVMGGAGAVVASIVCALYLSQKKVPVIDTIIEAVAAEVVAENETVAQGAEYEEVTLQNS